MYKKLHSKDNIYKILNNIKKCDQILIGNVHHLQHGVIVVIVGGAN